jgi:hypothetical protein
MRAGLKSLANEDGKDVTGTQVTNYQNMGRVYAIADQGKERKYSYTAFTDGFVLSSLHLMAATVAKLPSQLQKRKTALKLIDNGAINPNPLNLFISGTALLAISGEPNIEGVTVDTAAQDQKVVDRWANGKRDVRSRV